MEHRARNWLEAEGSSQEGWLPAHKIVKWKSGWSFFSLAVSLKSQLSACMCFYPKSLPLSGWVPPPQFHILSIAWASKIPCSLAWTGATEWWTDPQRTSRFTRYYRAKPRFSSGFLYSWRYLWGNLHFLRSSRWEIKASVRCHQTLGYWCPFSIASRSSPAATCTWTDWCPCLAALTPWRGCGYSCMFEWHPLKNCPFGEWRSLDCRGAHWPCESDIWPGKRHTA